jgi:hypothetical protein
MKKIALLYSGQPRDIKECYKNHLQVIWEDNKEHKIDVFAHIWYDKESYFWESYKNRGKWESWMKQYMMDSWEPKYIEFEEPKEFVSDVWEPNPKCPHPINNTISMFYSLYKSNQMKKRYEDENDFKYDCVVRLRTDTFFKSRIGSFFDYNLDEINLKSVPGTGYAHTEYGVEDQFAFAKSELMDKYFDVYENLDTIIESGSIINPETLLGWNIQIYNKVPVKKHNFNHILWRDVK